MRLGIKNFFLRFSVFDLVVMAMVASLGIAIKPLIVPLVHIITGPLFIPGGAVAGGFYMMWLVVGSGIVGKRGAASLIALVQAVMVIAVGVFGTHGIISLATYLAPGAAVDIFLLCTGQKNRNIISCFFSGMIANVTGTVLSNFVFFKLPWVPLVLALAGGALSGGLGGLLAYSIVKGFSRINISGFRISGK
ncbi:MAG: ECF transporter S component [Actinobacteria bacterium]|nr:ECF transporter S component [Actinomycetota bacterium]